jgi:hypothetical protein
LMMAAPFWMLPLALSTRKAETATPVEHGSCAE